MNKEWHRLTLSELQESLNTDLKRGLTVREAGKRIKNKSRDTKETNSYLFAFPQPSYLKCVLRSLSDPVYVVLLLVSLLSFVFGGSWQGALTLAVGTAACVITTVMSYITEKRLASASDNSSPTVRVIRDGDKYYTDGRNAVVGDIIELVAGDVLPCDVRLLVSDELLVKELVRTDGGIKNRTVGKSHAHSYIERDDIVSPNAANMLYAGSVILSGRAKAVVCETGSGVYLSEFISRGELAAHRGATEFERQLTPFLHNVRIFSLVSVAVLALLGLIFSGDEQMLDNFLLLLSCIAFLSIDTIGIGSMFVYGTYIDRLSGSRRTKKEGKADLSACVKSPRVMDKLCDVDTLALMGRSSITNGAYKVGDIFTCDGASFDLVSSDERGQRILELIYTYIKALDHARDESNKVSGDISTALGDVLARGKFDRKATDISIRSIYYVNDGTRGYACAETAGSQYRVALTFDDDILDFCELARKGADAVAMDDETKESAKDFCRENTRRGASCIYVVSENNGVATLEAVLALVQPAIDGFAWILTELSDLGIEPVIMLESEDDISLLSELGVSERYEGRIATPETVSDVEILDKCLDYSVYAGFSPEQYAEIVDLMRSKGRTVAVQNVEEAYESVALKSDVSVCYDAVNYSSDAYKQAAYTKMPACGKSNSLKSTPHARLLSGILIRRPHSSGGGIASVINALKIARITRISLSIAILLCIYVLSSVLPFAIVGVLSGIKLIDAYTALAMSLVASVLTFVLMTDKDYLPSLVQNFDKLASCVGFIRSKLVSVIARSTVSLVCAVSLAVVSRIGLFGEHPSLSAAVFVSLVLSLVIEVLVLNTAYFMHGEGRTKRWMKVVLAYAGMLLIFAISTQDIISSTLFPHGFGTLEFIAVPVYLILYVAAILVSGAVDKVKKS